MGGGGGGLPHEKMGVFVILLSGTIVDSGLTYDKMLLFLAVKLSLECTRRNSYTKRLFAFLGSISVSLSEHQKQNLF